MTTLVGVDFGTTSSVVALAEPGGASVVPHRLALEGGGEVVEPVFPSLVALPPGGGAPLFGLAAEELSRRSSARVLRSIKRQLANHYEGKALWVGGAGLPCRETLTGLLRALRGSTLASAGLPPDEPLLTVATVPANATSAQRWVTRRAFVDAGWGERVRLVDEPTAAALELASRALRRRRGAPAERTAILVYDLGGGTFDASFLVIDGEDVEVLATGGVSHLGGDDFDEELEALVVEELGLDLAGLSPLKRRSLRAECRRAKESLSGYPRPPKTLLVDLADLGVEGRRGSSARVPVEAFDARVEAYVDRTLEVVEEVLEGRGEPDHAYLVGGSSLLPAVARRVSERLPRVLRAPRPFESVAIGAALAHDRPAARVRDRLARHFGVLRVGAGHEYEYVDVLFPRGTRVPLPGQMTVARRGPYRPFFDVGLLRFLECGSVVEGRPGRDRRDWAAIRFPYAPELVPGLSLDSREPLRRDDLAVEVTEEYVLDSDGVVSVRIRREPDGHVELHEVCG